MKIWYVAHPLYLYNEDVKELAKRNGFRIVDALFQGKEENPKDAPKLTLKGEKPKPVKKVEDKE